MSATANNIIKLDAERRVRQKIGPTHHAETLSFMRIRFPKGTGIDYWCVTPTGNYGNDCATGGKLADEYLAYIGEHSTHGNGTLLTCIVREMIDRAKDGQEWSGIHVGFLAGVNRYAMATARMVTESREGGAA